MGVVYEAGQISLRRRVALKVLPFAAAMDPTQLRRFQTEALAAAQLHHTNIVPVHSVGSERGVHYLTIYELLSLRPAIDGQDRQEVLRKIAQEEPTPPRRRNSAIPRELETILLKAMNKEPGWRYATAQELADDLRRFLDDKPIKARRPTVWEHRVKSSRRHKPLVRSAVVVLVLAVVGLATGMVLLARKQAELERQRDKARHQGERARHIVDEMYTRLSERWLDQDPGNAELRREILGKAAQYYEQFAREPGTDPERRLEAARAWLRAREIGWTLRTTKEAEGALHRAIELFAELADGLSMQTLEPRDGQVRALIRLGDLLFVVGRNAEAERFYRAAIEMSHSIVADHPGVP